MARCASCSLLQTAKLEGAQIEGLHEFEGTLLHSANWDSSVNCTGKRVAVIGSGSSGIQIVPAMAEIASHVTAFNRSKSWIMPGICSEMVRYRSYFSYGCRGVAQTPDKQGANYKLTSEEIDRLVADPAYLMQQRKYVEHALQGAFAIPRIQRALTTRSAMFKPLMKDTPEQLEAQKMATELMRTQCNGDEELLAKLLPDYHGALPISLHGSTHRSHSRLQATDSRRRLHSCIYARSRRPQHIAHHPFHQRRHPYRRREGAQG